MANNPISAAARFGRNAQESLVNRQRVTDKNANKTGSCTVSVLLSPRCRIKGGQEGPKGAYYSETQGSIQTIDLSVNPVDQFVGFLKSLLRNTEAVPDVVNLFVQNSLASVSMREVVGTDKNAQMLLVSYRINRKREETFGHLVNYLTPRVKTHVESQGVTRSALYGSHGIAGIYVTEVDATVNLSTAITQQINLLNDNYLVLDESTDLASVFGSDPAPVKLDLARCDIILEAGLASFVVNDVQAGKIETFNLNKESEQDMNINGTQNEVAVEVDEAMDFETEGEMPTGIQLLQYEGDQLSREQLMSALAAGMSLEDDEAEQMFSFMNDDTLLTRFERLQAKLMASGQLQSSEAAEPEVEVEVETETATDENGEVLGAAELDEAEVVEEIQTFLGEDFSSLINLGRDGLSEVYLNAIESDDFEQDDDFEELDVEDESVTAEAIFNELASMIVNEVLDYEVLAQAVYDSGYGMEDLDLDEELEELEDEEADEEVVEEFEEAEIEEIEADDATWSDEDIEELETEEAEPEVDHEVLGSVEVEHEPEFDDSDHVEAAEPKNIQFMQVKPEQALVINLALVDEETYKGINASLADIDGINYLFPFNRARKGAAGSMYAPVMAVIEAMDDLSEGRYLVDTNAVSLEDIAEGMGRVLESNVIDALYYDNDRVAADQSPDRVGPVLGEFLEDDDIMDDEAFVNGGAFDADDMPDDITFSQLYNGEAYVTPVLLDSECTLTSTAVLNFVVPGFWNLDEDRSGDMVLAAIEAIRTRIAPNCEFDVYASVTFSAADMMRSARVFNMLSELRDAETADAAMPLTKSEVLFIQNSGDFFSAAASLGERNLPIALLASGAANGLYSLGGDTSIVYDLTERPEADEEIEEIEEE